MFESRVDDRVRSADSGPSGADEWSFVADEWPPAAGRGS
jgi:hypothetical protein